MKITLRSPKAGLVTREGQVSTLGQLKELFADAEINFNNIEFVDRQTKATYKVDSAKIPNVEELLFILVPMKNKSGVDLSTVKLNDISSMGYVPLRSLGSKLNKENNAGIDLSGDTTAVKKRITAYLLEQNSETPEGSDLFEEAKNQINAIIDVLKDKQAPPEQVVEIVETVMGLTEEEINAEAANLFKEFGVK